MDRVTITDIAKQLGVSSSTVSRALHNDKRISDQTRRDVNKLAVRVGYVPNVAARGLRTGRSGLIGFVVRDIRDPFSTETVKGVEAACLEHKYGLLLCNADDDTERELYYLKALHQRRVDGVMLLTPTSLMVDTYVSGKSGMPLVLMDTELEDPIACAITVDHVRGGYLATKHLLELGHTRIAFVSGPLHLSPCVRMVAGYRQAMAEAGLGPAQQMVIESKGTAIAHGQAAMADILKLETRPTAVATVSDLMAAGILAAAKESGMAVPGDLSIVGYDDIPMGSIVSPALTTVQQDKEALGRMAVELLLAEIEAPEHKHRQVMLKPSLIVRGSTGAAPRGT